MATEPVTLDFSKAIPIGGDAPAPAPAPDPASALQGAVSYGATQDPDKYANLLRLMKRTGVPPAVSSGIEPHVRQAADVNSIDYPAFAAANPRTTAWASNPDNAAVSGVDEVQRLGGIEQNAAAMRSVTDPPAPSFWSSLKGIVTHPLETLVGADTPAQAAAKQATIHRVAQQTGDPFFSDLVATQDAAEKPLLSVSGSATFQRILDPKSQNVFSRAMTGGTKAIEALSSPGNLQLLGSLPFAPEDAGALISGVFSTQMAEGAASSSYDAIRAAYHGEYGDAAEAGAGALINAAFAAQSGKHALTDRLTMGLATEQSRSEGVRNPIAGGTFLDNLSQAIDAAADSKLRERAPDKFDEANQANFDGDASLRVPSEQFNSYFKGKGIDPADVAKGLGSTNYTEAVMSGGDVEIPPADFLSKLDPEHQKALLPDIIDPSSGLTARQHQEGLAELQEWASGGGAEKLAADTAAADAETAATPEYAAVKEQLLQRYTDAGETPEVAETLAAKDANAYSNLARSAGMKPSELLSLYNPKVVSGEAPEGVLHQSAIDSPEFKQWFGESKAVDESGRPSTVYHGTAKEFESFDPGQTGKRQAFDTGDFGNAIYFADKPETAEGYAESSAATRPFAYAGPEATREDLLKIADARETNAATSMAARDVARWMVDDKTLGEGMAISGSPALAEKLGGKLEPAGPELKPHILPVHLKAENPLVLRNNFTDLYDLALTPEERETLSPKKKAERWMQTHPAEMNRLIREAGYDSVHDEDYGQWAVFDPKQVKSSIGNSGAFDPSDANILHQGAGDGTRGWFRVLPDGSYEIGKTKIGDLSTFVHEPAHAYLKILGDLSKRDGATQWLKDDYQKALEFLGAKDGEPLTREQQETWARANEQYLREGKAPSEGAKGVFERFAVWLGRIYKKASDLGVNLSDDIRGVFDRLYAAEDGVNKAEREAGPKLFNSPEEAGWTDEQFKEYADEHSMTAEQAKAAILGKLREAAARDKTDSWREEEKNVRAAVTADVDQRPEYSAIRALRRGALDDGTEITMSRDELVKQFGEDRVKELQKLHPGLYRNEGGADPEIAAEVFGFHSAADMMKALEAAPRRSAAIETATRAYMTANHGDLRYDGSLHDDARFALENDKRSSSLYRELRALKGQVWKLEQSASAQKERMGAIEIAPLESYREAAHQMIEQKAVADLNPTRYLDASRKYSREAFEALRKGNARAGAEAKHKELMNHFLFREATEAKEYVTKFEAYAKRMQKVSAQSALGLAGGDFRDQFNRILGRYGLGPKVGPADRTLGEWATAEYAKGNEPAIDPVILNEARTVNYRNAPVAEIRALRDALVNVRKLASLELGISVNGKRIEFRDAITSMDAKARENLKVKPTRVLKGNATLGEKIGDLAQRGDALLMRTERLMEWLDGGKTGPWHDNLWNLAADSQGNEYKLQEQVTKQLGDALDNLPKEQRAKMLEKVTVDGIGETVTRHDLVSMAFNLGNDGNLDRLEKTFDAHGWDHNRAIEQIKRMLTREEWQFVQDGWDSLKPLGQAEGDLEKRLTGLPPRMVKPTPLHIELADGSTMDLAGGYYPIVMDPRFGTHGAQQDARTTAQNLMEAGYGRAATSRGAMKERTGFGGPLQLDYEQVLTQHTAKVIKDITHREFMLAASKLLLAPEIRQTMRETLGEGYEEQMMPWLRTIINDRNGSAVQGLGDFSQMMRALRTNLTLATLSYKISTSLLQWTHAPRMLLSTNPGSYAQAMVDFLKNPSAMTEQIKGLSPNEMAGRGDNLDRDIRAVLRGDPGIQRSVARAGNVSIKYTDHVLSFPLWLSVYRDALKQHVDLPEDRAQYLASHAADSAVRLGLGSAAPKDLPPIMRSNDLSKLLTMFYSFHNGIYGQVRDIGHQFAQNGGAGKLTYGLALSVLVPSILGGMVSGNGPKEGENKGLWAAKRALLFSADTVPLLRDAASAIDSDGEVKNPLMNVLTKGTKATQEALSDSDDKDWNGIGLSYLEVGGDVAGVPGTTQAMKPLRYMNQVQRGNVDSPNVWDAVAGSAPHK